MNRVIIRPNDLIRLPVGIICAMLFKPFKRVDHVMIDLIVAGILVCKEAQIIYLWVDFGNGCGIALCGIAVDQFEHLFLFEYVKSRLHIYAQTANRKELNMTTKNAPDSTFKYRRGR